MKKHIGILLLLISTQLMGQDLSEQSFIERTDFKIGYFGNVIWNQGISIGGEYKWKEKTKVKQSKKGERISTRQLLISSTIGYTENPGTLTDNGILVNAGLIWRKTKPRGTQFSWEITPLGYFRSILPQTFEVDGDNVTEVNGAGNNYYAPSVAFGIGRYRADRRRSGWHINLRLGVRTPYNGDLLPTVSLEFAQRFNFKKRK